METLVLNSVGEVPESFSGLVLFDGYRRQPWSVWGHGKIYCYHDARRPAEKCLKDSEKKALALGRKL